MDFSQDIKDGCLITGGHFMLTSAGPHLNEGTIDSFSKAVFHYAHNRHKKAALGLLINDIGAVCSPTSCTIAPEDVSKTEFRLPSEYVGILQEAGVAEKELIIFWEKHMRNRGKKALHKLLSHNSGKIVETEEGYIYQCPTSRVNIILTRRSPNDKYGTPACPLIMSAYFLENKKLGFTSSLNFYYVGEDNELNVANHYVIEKGRFLALEFSGDLDVKNVYLFKNSFMKNWNA
jgi:hypothetical protein